MCGEGVRPCPKRRESRQDRGSERDRDVEGENERDFCQCTYCNQHRNQPASPPTGSQTRTLQFCFSARYFRVSLDRSYRYRCLVSVVHFTWTSRSGLQAQQSTSVCPCTRAVVNLTAAGGFRRHRPTASRILGKSSKCSKNVHREDAILLYTRSWKIGTATSNTNIGKWKEEKHVAADQVVRARRSWSRYWSTSLECAIPGSVQI